MSVVAFKRPEPNDPHLAGEARCIGCQHKWAAVAPVGTRSLECPSCKTMNGLWTYPVGPEVGDLAFACNCGCDALTAYKRRGLFHIVCMSCGEHQTEALFGA